jgi:hypothetical protein
LANRLLILFTLKVAIFISGAASAPAGQEAGGMGFVSGT